MCWSFQRPCIWAFISFTQKYFVKTIYYQNWDDFTSCKLFCKKKLCTNSRKNCSCEERKMTWFHENFENKAYVIILI